MLTLKIVAPLPAISKRTRLTKIVECASDIQEVNFYGWQRLKSEIPDPEGKIILKGGGYSSKKARLMYILWIIKVFFLCISFKKDDVVWALGFESAFPAILAAKIKGFRVIYDDADRFSSLFNFPSLLKKILIKLEIYSSHNAFRHIIPGNERYEFESPNFFILKNTPTAADVLKAKKFALDELVQNKLNEYKITIYVNGWLGDGRGLKVIHDVAKQLPSVAFLLAGRVDSKYAESMLKFKNVIYLGEVPQYQALAYYKLASFVFTYYDPKIPINRMAEANKWGDALQFGTPIIVNSEVVTAQYLRDANSALSVSYDDVNTLISSLNSMLSDPKEYLRLRESIQDLQSKFPAFDYQLINLFKSLEQEK